VSVSVILTWMAGTLLVVGSGLVLYFVAQADVGAEGARADRAVPPHDGFGAPRAA
jgi:hypothetical protein